MILAAAPALPLHAAGKYVAGAYIVFVVVLVVYLAIMTLRTNRTNRELAVLRHQLAERQAREELDGAGIASSEGEPEPEREPAL